MQPRFDYFVIIAEMRTGSNYLEANLNSLSDVKCVGEAFNPNFIGYPKTDQIGGVTRHARDEEPMRLITAIKGFPGALAGFRYFGDHDPRVFDVVIEDPRCAKIILTRNPIESYVSLKIARETGQWKLTNVKQRKAAQIRFDADEFDRHLTQLQEFQRKVLHKLQLNGQTAFYLSYEDLQDLDVLNGMIGYLGSAETLQSLDGEIKKQNPSALSEKVLNFDEMARSISAIDAFDLARTPNFEPRRGPAVPGFVMGMNAPLLYMPIRSGPESTVLRWMAALDGIDPKDLPSPRNQKDLRQWKRRNIGHRSFTVLRHPVARAHHAFCTKILATGPGSFLEIRKALRNVFKLPLPGRVDANYDKAQHRAAFLGFIDFLGKNLTGQTNLRVDANWATQSTIVQGMAQFCLPDMILREEDIAIALPEVAKSVGYEKRAACQFEADNHAFSLGDFWDDEVEARVREIYQRDYMMFGFGPWRGIG